MKWDHPPNNVPFKKWGHTANLIGNSIYLFGGSIGLHNQNDIQKYDVQSQTLQKAITRGNTPSARKSHSSAVIEEKLYIFGGCGVRVDTNKTLYSLNIICSEWIAIPIAESSGSLPKPRYGMSMFSFES